MDQRQPEEDVVGAIKGFFDDEERAVEEFFNPQVPRRVLGKGNQESIERPTHYKVISISLYTEDIARLNELVKDLKRRGHSRASKSMLIREALRQLNLDAVPKQR